MNYDTRTIQQALNNQGYGPIAEDGILGPATKAAIVRFKKDHNLRPRPYVGPITWAKLTQDSSDLRKRVAKDTGIPWYDEMSAHLGLHEIHNHAELATWLRSDGATVGDPAEIPWCGDAVETAIANTLPNEKLPSNPYLAANWVDFGVEVKPQLGSVLVFWRGSPNSWKGHIGFYAGESRDNFYVLGGNQSNAITIAPLSKRRLRGRGSRWPSIGPKPTGRRVSMTGGAVSTNEV